ncbi:MAG: phosphatidylglycerol lysyltransferase domain-containing protein [Clostridiales bacterium]|nr:phosphatidylglycerol lysyltransferase domain-containing protein [Clostridiales bacterium]
MLCFKTPEIEDKIWIDECLKSVHSYNCEYTFGNIFLWKAAYRTAVCHYKDFMLCRWGKDDDVMYSVPIGKGDIKDAIEQLLLDSKSIGIPLRLYGVTLSYKSVLDSAFPNKFRYEFDDSMSDYIYDVQKMATLSGKKYHGKRNHITNFKKNNPNWSFEIIDNSNISDCIKLHTEWINNHEDDSDYSFEFEAVLSAFENYEKLNLVGGLIRVDGKAIAYTMGERHSDDLFVTHFEKAPADMQGAYPLINQEFTKNCLMNYKYVNREEDLGIDGLRKAKQSYYPEILLEKYLAVYEE